MREIISSIEAEYRRYKILGEGAIRQTHEDELSRAGDNNGNSIAVLVWHISGNPSNTTAIPRWKNSAEGRLKVNFTYCGNTKTHAQCQLRAIHPISRLPVRCS